MVNLSLAGKTVLVTGGAVRVGRQISIAAAQAGANVMVHYSGSAEDAQSLTSEIRDMGVLSWAVQQDFRRTDEIADFVDRCWRITNLDILVNNSAIFKPLSMKTTSLKDWDDHLAINLTTPFLLSQRFIHLLEPGMQGRIINMLDWRALRPGADHLPYTIAKAGLAALTQALAQAAAPHVLVNGIAPGALLPPAHGVNEADLFEDYPVKRWAEPSEVTQTFLFLAAGPEYITGEIIHLDGGRHLI